MIIDGAMLGIVLFLLVVMAVAFSKMVEALRR